MLLPLASCNVALSDYDDICLPVQNELGGFFGSLSNVGVEDKIE